jgi:hypothetical protein
LLQNPTRRPLGRLTVALTLIAVGLALLVSTLGLITDLFSLLKLWPLLLISLGAEVLIARWQGVRSRFDWGGVILIVLFLGLVTSGAAAKRIFEGGGFPAIFAIGSSQSSGRTALTLPPDVKQFEVRSTSGSVELRGSTSNEVQVDATYWGQDRGTATPQPRLVTENGVIRLEVEPGDWTDISARYQISLPAGLTVNVQSESGLVRASGVKGDLTLANHSGALIVEQGEGKLTLSTHSGLVNVTDHRGGLSINANSGAIRLQGIAGPVDAETNSGVITLDLASGVGAQVSAKAGSGIIHGPSWLTVQRSGSTQTASGRLGNGEYTISLQTGSGSISVDAR